MWTLLITLYALVLLALIAATTYVAISATDRQRGNRATTVLKLLLVATLSATGLFALLVQLHHAGLV